MRTDFSFAPALAGLATAAALMMPLQASAVPLASGFGGPANFGELAMNPNDDGSSNELDLPFTINFFGQTHSTFFINNNGNITFNDSVGAFTPRSFPASSNPMIAPFWGDVDTRCGTCGAVYVATPNPQQVVVTWNNVGYFAQHTNLVNNFQVILTDRSGTVENGATLPSGDFDITFRYDRLEWTTGDASGGSGGFGGTPAQAGFDAGDGVNFFTLPGSQTASVLDLKNTTNVAGGPAGLWTFAIRSGGLPGSTPSNPLMPVINQSGWDFDFNVDLNQQVFIDPDIAIGYDYIVNSGPNFASVLLPTGIGDNLFDLWLWNGTDWVDSGIDLTGGVEHLFGPGGVDRFRILGIEQSAGLDPTDTTAFVTGLRFTDAGQVNMSQNPLIVTIPDQNGDVPEPPMMLITATALLGMAAMRRRRRTLH
ncbi:MAG: hypothetical protein KDH20_13300 [Rhodocyclaceae bacterium]|nr:hypothetical protein [Rhodocyclaceae bacterium]